MNASRRKNARLLAWRIAIAASAFAIGCSTGAPHLADGRLLAISPTPRGGMPTNPSLIGEAVSTARHADVNADQMSNNWIDLETAPGKYSMADPAGGFRYLGGRLGWTIEYTIGVVDTTVKQTPADLKSVAFDDPKMISRFHGLVDALKPVVNSHVSYIAVGNEVDIFLAQHPAEWDAYKKFLDDAIRYIHSKLPGVKVGTATTFDGAVGTQSDRVRRLISNCDVAIITYYPLGKDFKVRPPDSPLNDFPRMAAFAAGKPIVLQEAGYPSSAKLGSSPRNQAEFVDNVFTAWNQNAKAIPFLSYVMLHDLNREFCDSRPAYYGLPDPEGHFAAYFCTLGLRTEKGVVKPAWNRFRRDAHKLIVK
jgi:hypothetical protein